MENRKFFLFSLFQNIEERTLVSPTNLISYKATGETYFGRIITRPLANCNLYTDNKHIFEGLQYIFKKFGFLACSSWKKFFFVYYL